MLVIDALCVFNRENTHQNRRIWNFSTLEGTWVVSAYMFSVLTDNVWMISDEEAQTPLQEDKVTSFSKAVLFFKIHISPVFIIILSYGLMQEQQFMPCWMGCRNLSQHWHRCRQSTLITNTKLIFPPGLQAFTGFWRGESAAVIFFNGA